MQHSVCTSVWRQTALWFTNNGRVLLTFSRILSTELNVLSFLSPTWYRHPHLWSTCHGHPRLWSTCHGHPRLRPTCLWHPRLLYKMTGRSVRHRLWNTLNFSMRNATMQTKSFSTVGLSLHESMWSPQVYYFDLKLKTPKEGEKAQWVEVAATKPEDLFQFPKSTW